MVDNGETVVLGGVYTVANRNAVDRVPFFGDLPYLGFLFKRTQEEETKSELLIFVTPKILKENLQI
jgi:type IV pilus assembly protein PilQ